MNCKDVLAALARRYAPPEWAFFEEIGLREGRRRFDAIAINTFESRGLEVHGLEVKVDRRDWLRELRDPAKSEELISYCDRWWIVVPDAAIVRREEIPASWGLLVASSRRNVVLAKRAPKLEPKDLTRNFVARLFRRIHETTIPKSTHERRVRAELAKDRKLRALDARWVAEPALDATRSDFAVGRAREASTG